MKFPTVKKMTKEEWRAGRDFFRTLANYTNDSKWGSWEESNPYEDTVDK